MVGEIKKQKYIHYHCAGHKGKCGEPYTREELLEERFTALLKKPLFDDDVFDWMRQALTESRADGKREHAEVIHVLRRNAAGFGSALTCSISTGLTVRSQRISMTACARSGATGKIDARGTSNAISLRTTATWTRESNCSN